MILVLFFKHSYHKIIFFSLLFPKSKVWFQKSQEWYCLTYDITARSVTELEQEIVQYISWVYYSTTDSQRRHNSENHLYNCVITFLSANLTLLYGSFPHTVVTKYFVNIMIELYFQSQLRTVKIKIFVSINENIY